MSRRHLESRTLGWCSVFFALLVAVPAVAQFQQVPEQGAEPAAKPTVVPPRLVTFQAAVYPKEAEQAGLTADVVLRLTIDATGSVSEAEVVEAVGNGFDEAARAAALKFVFEPATRDGVPTAARILYRYSFTLTTVEKAPESAATPTPLATAPTAGNLEGTLTVLGTDLPLVGAQIRIKKPDGTELALVSDEKGQYRLEGVPAGAYQVTIVADGFLPTEAEEAVLAGEVTDVTYRLVPQPEDQGEVIEVTVEGERPPREVTRRTIERREIERIPGTSGDAIRSIESLPGVARPPGLAGLLLVRGSYPEDTQVYVDGSDIPQIYHFGGLRSVLPTELVSRIDFYPGNFGARFGRGMGGVVDVGLRSPDTQCRGDYGKLTEKGGCFNGLVQMDLIEGRALLQGPLPMKDWSFAVGARRSWIDAWLGPVLEQTTANITTLPVFYDYQVIAEHKTSDDSRLSLRFFGADDRFAAVVDPFAEEPGFGGNLRFSQTFMQGQVLYEKQLTRQVSSASMASVQKSSIGFGIGVFKFDLNNYPIYLRQEFGWKVLSGLKINTGLDYQLGSYDIAVRVPNPPRPGEPDSGPFSTRPALEVVEEGTLVRQGWYVDAEVVPNDRLRIVPSLRLDYAKDSGGSDVSPRVNARYDLLKGGVDEDGAVLRRTTLKAGAGYYHQPPQFQETNQVFGTPGLKSNQAIHYALGVEQELTQHLDVGVEGFYKDFDDLVAPAPVTVAERYTNLGTGRVVGLETLLRYKPDRRFFGWVAYTISRSERQDSAEEDPYLIQYDQTHNLTVLGSYRLGRGWEIGGRFRLISGSLETPVRGAPNLPALYVGETGSYVPMQGAFNSQRLPLFHQLDFRIDKRFQFRTWRLSCYLDVYNAYNNPAIEGISYDFNYANKIYATGVPILPSLGAKGEF